MSKIKYVALAARWQHRTYGNTYHSVRIMRCRDGATIVCPMQDGYGDHYRQTALAAMAAAKWLPVKYRTDGKYMMYERDNDYPISWSVSDGTKAECKRHGEG